jgi:hypothetical protein
MGIAALLVGVPLFVGAGWARWDYSRTRDTEARRIIDALASYYEKESMYPDELSQLVEAGLLDAVPRPHIGFTLEGKPAEFTYQGFGTSYLLEFSAPRWVQCAYNPPYEEEDGDMEETAADAGDAPAEGDDETALSGGAWSCPSKPPELW